MFGSSQKAGRVIPNKAYQALACGRLLVTREAPAWQGIPQDPESGIWRVPPGDPQVLADTLARCLAQPEQLGVLGAAARRTYDAFLSEQHVRAALAKLLAGLALHQDARKHA